MSVTIIVPPNSIASLTGLTRIEIIDRVMKGYGYGLHPRCRVTLNKKNRHITTASFAEMARYLELNCEKPTDFTTKGEEHAG